jgi:hypothetical protein
VEDRPFILQNNGRARFLGLIQPKGSLALVDGGGGAGAGTRPRPTATTTTGVVQNAANVYDTVATAASTYATITVATANGTSSLIATTWAGNTDVSRSLNIAFSGSSLRNDDGSGDSGTIREPANFVYSVYTSVDTGTTFTLIRSGQVVTGRLDITDSIADGVNLNTLQVKIVLTNTAASKSASASLNVFDIAVVVGGSVSPYSTMTSSVGIRYAYTEVLKYEYLFPGETVATTIEVESALSPLSPDISATGFTFAAFYGVSITRGALANSTATHWRIYRSIDTTDRNTSLAIDTYSRIKEIDATISAVVDHLDEDGHPLSFQDTSLAPPMIIVGDIIFDSNTPPPDSCDVIGSFQGSATFASGVKTGIWWWSRPLQPDYVPAIYSDLVPGRVTAFVDIGVHLVFTNQSVHAYPYLPLASDSDFIPARQRRDVSKSRGCVSRRGACIFEVPGAETLAAFVSSDGIYTTNGAQMELMTHALDWPTAVSLTSLSTAELTHSPNERKLILAYTNSAGARKALDFCYGREGGIVVVGPRPWPADSTTSVIRNNRVDIYSSASGLVYLEDQGTVDNAALENADKRITFTASLPQFYVGEKRRLNTVSIHTPSASDVTLTVTVNTRIDGQADEVFTGTLTADFDFDGWKDISVGRECESFNITFASTSANFPGIDAVMFDLEGDSAVSPQRISQ